MSTATKMRKRAESFRVEGLSGLSRSAADFLRRRPNEARMVVAVALEAAAAQYQVNGGFATVAVPESLKPFIIHRPRGADVIGVSETAVRLKVSRTTVYDWVEKKTLLAWKPTKRGLMIPAEQILGPGKVVPGITRVLEIINDPELAWAFLIQEWPFADKVGRPLDKLKAGEIEDVVDAAPGFGTTFT